MEDGWLNLTVKLLKTNSEFHFNLLVLTMALIKQRTLLGCIDCVACNGFCQQDESLCAFVFML